LARPTSRPKPKRSLKVRELRTRLGDSQQRFSNRLEMALQTIARYEGPQPPNGAALLKLANLAKQNDFPDLQNYFAGEYIEEAFNDGLLELIVVGEDRAYLHQQLEGLDEVQLAKWFVIILDEFRSSKADHEAKRFTLRLLEWAANKLREKATFGFVWDESQLPEPKPAPRKTTTSRKKEKKEAK
jgi:transcriptional regulator with XRE-family HTH domain